MSKPDEINHKSDDSEIEIIENNKGNKLPKKQSFIKKNTALIVLVFSVALFSLTAGSICTNYFNNLNKSSVTSSRFNGNYGSVDTPIDQQSNNGSGMMGGQNRGGMGYYNSSSSSSTNRFSGVAISVADGSFVIAGNGDRYTVNTTSSTTYSGTADSVSVNDSVMVSGELSSSTITATSVRIMNM